MMWVLLLFLSGIHLGHFKKSENVQISRSQCSLDLLHIRQSISQEKWAMQMVDAFGKPDAGILWGRMTWVGNYQECLDVSAPSGNSSAGFKGKYCWLKFNTSLQDIVSLQMQTPLKIGGCFPSSCESEELVKIFKEFSSSQSKGLVPALQKLLKETNLSSITCIPQTTNLSTPAVGYLIFLITLITIVVIATAIDLRRNQLTNLQKEKKDIENGISPETASEVDNITTNLDHNEAEVSAPLISPKKQTYSNCFTEILQCFSAAKGCSVIFDITERTGQLHCLHGIRVLSITWIIMGHAWFIFVILDKISYPLKYFELPFLLSSQILMQSLFAVDSFFFLSGFLQTFLILKDGSLPKSVAGWISIFAYRYIRLTPAYAMVLGFFMTLWNYLGSGPFWQYDRETSGICDGQWWWNLLYVNNFQILTKMCMGWSWYLANDMQFCVISPLFLISLKRWPIAGVSLVSITILTSSFATFFISYRNHFRPTGREFTLAEGETFDYETTLYVNRNDMIYSKPYFRISPYLIGMLLAYFILFARKIILRKRTVWFGWTIATIGGLVLMYGLYLTQPGDFANAAFNAFSRPAWSLCLGWLTFACISGYGGPVNALLSTKYFLPFSRLTYCVYLLHPLIMMWYYNSLQDLFYLNLTNMIMLYLAFLLLAFGLAFVAFLLFESPFVLIQKMLLRMFKKFNSN